MLHAEGADHGAFDGYAGGLQIFRGAVEVLAADVELRVAVGGDADRIKLWRAVAALEHGVEHEVGVVAAEPYSVDVPVGFGVEAGVDFEAEQVAIEAKRRGHVVHGEQGAKAADVEGHG